MDRYQYTAEDIPADQLELIKDQINPRTFDDIMKDLNEQIGLSDLKEIILQKQEQLLYAQKSGKSTYGINPGYYFLSAILVLANPQVQSSLESAFVSLAS